MLQNCRGLQEGGRDPGTHPEPSPGLSTFQKVLMTHLISRGGAEGARILFTKAQRVSHLSQVAQLRVAELEFETGRLLKPEL